MRGIIRKRGIFHESGDDIYDPIGDMEADSEPLADDIDTPKAEVTAGRARAAADQALIAHQQLQIPKFRHQLYGQRSERAARLIEQVELSLEEAEAAATEEEIAAEQAAARTTNVAAFTRKRPSRQPFPEYLPRERLVEPAPANCRCCGGARRRKLGEDVTETLEVIPRRWKVIQHVREKFTCRDCEAITQPPAPSHVTPRGWIGPNLLAVRTSARTNGAEGPHHVREVRTASASEPSGRALRP